MLKLWVGVLALLASSGFAADAIEGTWKTESGELAVAAPCPAGFCLMLNTGKYKGQEIGQLKGRYIASTLQPAYYSGTVRDPADDKVYSGKAEIKGRNLMLSGCVLKVFCKTQTWTRN